MQSNVVDLKATNTASAFLTPDEAANHLALSKRTLENFRIRGGGPRFHKFGRKVVRYHYDDLAAWIEGARRSFTNHH